MQEGIASDHDHHQHLDVEAATTAGHRQSNPVNASPAATTQGKQAQARHMETTRMIHDATRANASALPANVGEYQTPTRLRESPFFRRNFRGFRQTGQSVKSISGFA